VGRETRQICSGHDSGAFFVDKEFYDYSEE
jgi:hypothetical protein